QSYVTLASGGMHKPVSFLKVGEDKKDSIAAERVLREDVARSVMAALETVVDDGEGGGAKAAQIPFYQVAGKTGTAHIVGSSGYEKKAYNALFAGYAPASDPKVVIVVVMNEPSGREHYGSQVAAPLVGKIASGAMRILGVPPDNLEEAELLNLSERYRMRFHEYSEEFRVPNIT